jgi:hypothetical protein
MLMPLHGEKMEIAAHANATSVISPNSSTVGSRTSTRGTHGLVQFIIRPFANVWVTSPFWGHIFPAIAPDSSRFFVLTSCLWFRIRSGAGVPDHTFFKLLCILGSYISWTMCRYIRVNLIILFVVVK